MYETRQNKEKVSRTIDACGGTKQKKNNNRTIQRFFTVNNNYDDFQGGEIERARNYISRYQPWLLSSFEETERSSEEVTLDQWLMNNIGINIQGIDYTQRRMDEQMRNERRYRRDATAIPPPSVNLFYGEEDCSGALATIRAQPSMTRFGNRAIMTTFHNDFPNDEMAQRNRNEFIERGGEILTGVDVRRSIYEEQSEVPFNISNVTFYYPRNDRGVSPSTAQITSAFVNRASEAGQGTLALPSSETYGGNPQTVRSLYGGRQFETTMEQTDMYVAEVEPGPESELEVFGYRHRRTGRTDSISHLVGSTMTLRHGSGRRGIMDYYDEE